jgi:hypothetical protein
MKPKGHWNIDTLRLEALKYSSKKEFQEKSGSAYNAAGRLKVRDQICGHMENPKKPNGFWNKNTLQIEALKYTSRQEFQEKSGSAYNAAGRLKVRDQICNHMVEIKKPKGHWTIENLQAEALKYDNKVDFREQSNPAFLIASRMKVLDQICSHMTPGKLPNGHWLVKDNCAKEALKYTNRREFSMANSSAYHGADVNGWLDEICSHMDFNPSSDGDTIYIWKAIGHFYSGIQVYKLGSTSARLENRRIVEVARMAGMEYEIILLTRIQGHTSDLETRLLGLGLNPQYDGFNGSSEFRALSDEELKIAVMWIKVLSQ